MPTVNVVKDELFRMLGRSFTEEEFDKLCFAYGLEYDGETSQKKMIARERATDKSGASDHLIQNASEETLLRIEVAANRYDLLCVEGLVLALRSFLGLDADPACELPLPRFVAKKPTTRMTVDASVLEVRPVIMCAIVRNIAFTERSFASFIDMQDKLHQTLCKRRSLASIGTHDLDHVEAPFTYEARRPEDIHFCPLRGTDGRVVDGRECLAALESDLALRDYLPLIRDKARYPVVCDATGAVMSLPPIINGSKSMMSKDTRNVFLEVTATDETKCEIVLQTVACLFSMYATPRFEIEQVEVVSGATTRITPPVAYRTQTADVAYINTQLGLHCTAAEQLHLLRKMGMEGTASADGTTISVAVPPHRSDILHECDIMEEVAIAYGFNNIKPLPCPTPTTGHQLVRTKIEEKLAAEIAYAGFCQVLTFALCKRADNFATLRRPDDGSAIAIPESKSTDVETARVSLLANVLRSVASNKALPLPIRVFEIGDVVRKDAAAPVGARNFQNVCAVQCDVNSGFDAIHGLLDRVMLVLGVPTAAAAAAAGDKNKVAPYSLRASHDGAFIDGLCADVLVGDRKVGVIGVVHPDVLAACALDAPCSAFELTLDFPLGI